jgi:hypothetical protein
MAASEGLILDSLDLNDSTTYILLGLEIPPPKKRYEWVTGGDTNGGVLGRDPLFENREVMARIAIAPQSTMDLALAKIAAISDKLEEAERSNTGVVLQWTPADATLTTGTFRCLSGEITGLPIMVSGEGAGWFVKSPEITVTMTCDPFMRGAEVSVGTTSASTLPLVTLELTSVAGDVAAEGRLVVTDAASQIRRLLRWGLESRFYPTSSPPGLIMDSDALVTTGYAGTGQTRTGAYDPGAAGSSTVRASVPTQVVAVCGTGVQTHVGTFHVYARMWFTGSTTFTRLSWQDGDGPLRSNPWVQSPITAAWMDMNLGIITTTTAVSGSQKWLGRIDAYDTASAVNTIDVDYIYLVPAMEGFGEARATYAYQPGTVIARDEFTGNVAGTALNGLLAPLGGTWTTSGSATDFTAADAPLATDETMSRATLSDGAFPANARHARLGATNFTDIEVGVDIRFTAAFLSLGIGVFARWVDASNFVAFGNFVGADSPGIYVYVAGALSARYDFQTRISINTWARLRLVVYATGIARALLLDENDAIVEDGALSHSTLATGGTLATGRPGFIDTNGGATAVTRYYDNFYAATPTAEPVVMYSGRTAEIRSTMAIRPDSTGTYYGDVPAYRGSRFFVPPAGTRGRKARIAVMARRNDVVVNPDDQIADSTTIQAFVTPRFVNVPR